MNKPKKTKYKKATPWNKIQAEYLQGVTPKDIAEKYDIPAKKINEKASKEGWVKQKATISKNLQAITQERIQELSNLALDTLESVLTAIDTENHIKVQASKALLEISGLKSSKQEIKNVTPQIVVLSKEDAKALERIKNDI